MTLEARSLYSHDFWLPNAKPNVYKIRCEGCDSSSYDFEIHAYSGNKTTITKNPKLKIPEEIIDGVKEVLEIVPWAEKLEWKTLQGEAKAEAEWKEYTDHRAFYSYNISIGYQPLIGVDFKISVGQSWLKKYIGKIPKIGEKLSEVVDYLIKAGVYLKLSGNISVNFNYKRENPIQPQFVKRFGAGATGQLKVSIGIELSVLEDKIISIDLNASGKIVVKGDSLLNEQGFGLGLKVEFGGLKGEGAVKINYIWGTIEFKESWTLIKPIPIWPRSGNVHEIYILKNE